MDTILTFTGTVHIEHTKPLKRKALAAFMAETVSLDLETFDGEGETEGVCVVGVDIDWGTLKHQK